MNFNCSHALANNLWIPCPKYLPDLSCPTINEQLIPRTVNRTLFGKIQVFFPEYDYETREELFWWQLLARNDKRADSQAVLLRLQKCLVINPLGIAPFWHCRSIIIHMCILCNENNKFIISCFVSCVVHLLQSRPDHHLLGSSVSWWSSDFQFCLYFISISSIVFWLVL